MGNTKAMAIAMTATTMLDASTMVAIAARRAWVNPFQRIIAQHASAWTQTLRHPRLPNLRVGRSNTKATAFAMTTTTTLDASTMVAIAAKRAWAKPFPKTTAKHAR